MDSSVRNAEIVRLRRALRTIAHTADVLYEESVRQDAPFNGDFAAQLANSPSFLRSVARDALDYEAKKRGRPKGDNP